MSFLQSLRPNPKTLRTELISGFATGLFSIPEGMAYAQLAGVNPVYGLYSGMAATLVASLSTGTILMISTLTSAIALSTGSVLTQASIQSSQMPAALFTITFMVGAIMLGMGLLRLGSIVNFVSNSVMTGFVAAASLLILIGELGDFSGYAPTGSNNLAEMANWFANINQWDLTTTAVGIVTVLMMVVLKRFKRTERLAAIITLLVMTIVVKVIGLNVALVSSIATIPSGLPGLTVPDFSLIPKLALGSLSVALVALVQGAGISTAYPNPDGTRASQSRDFVGEGLGNLVGSFFQSMSTGGSLSRTGISVSAGASSRWGGVLAALWLALIVLLFGSAAENVPLTVIAGMLFVIAVELIMARVPSMRLMYESSWGSVAAGFLTFFSAMFIPLQYTIFLGAGLSLALYIYASSRSVNLRQLSRNDRDRWVEGEAPDSFPANKVTALSFSGLEFFAEVPVLQDLMPDVRKANNAAIILDVRSLDTVHSTGVKWFQNFIEQAKSGSNQVFLAEVQPGFKVLMDKVGLTTAIGSEYVFAATEEIGGGLDDAWEAAQAWVDREVTAQAQDTSGSTPA